MSNGRRKSKKPQKWEELESSEAILQNPDLSSALKDQLSNTYPSNEFTLSIKSSPRADGDMTVLEVFQGHRQGFISECTQCCLQIRDWITTVDHIHLHRSSYIPGCYNKLSNRGLACNLCDEMFPDHSQFVSHVYSIHGPLTSPELLLLCPFCGKQFASSADAQKHFDITCILLKCPVCSAISDHEYKLYSHLSSCLPNFHPYLKSLICHVCWKPVAMSSLADHMISHRSLGKNHVKSKTEIEDEDIEEIEYSSSDGNLFLCEVCDKRFSIFKSFQNHLFEHSKSNKYCPLCLLKGFSKTSFVVRHLILRCPTRSHKQLSLASFINTVAQREDFFFIDVICHLRHDRTLLEAMRTWANIDIVLDFLKSYVAASENELESLLKRSHLKSASTSPLPSDVELLQWLSQYELQFQRGELSLAPDASKDMASWIPPKNVSKAEYDAMLSTFFKSINESRITGSPSVFNLESGNLNAEVQIHAIPPDQSEAIFQSYQNVDQDSSTCRPSIEFIKKNCPGVVLLPDIDLETLRKVSNEADKEKHRDWISESIRSGYVTKDHLHRLEMEAQHLRELEPFFMVSKPSIEFSVLRKKINLNEDKNFEPDPALLESLVEQAQDLVKNSSNFICDI